VIEFRHPINSVLLIATLACGLFGINTSVVAQDENLQTKSISVCPFELTPTGRMASFRFSFTYRLRVDDEGISRVDEI